MTMPRSRTVRRRRLGYELRRLREDAGMTIEAVALRLECSDSRLSLIENGKQGSKPKAVRELAQIYGLRDPERLAGLEALARSSNEKNWWAGFEDVLPARFSTYVDLETDARELLAYSALMAHGLLQTEDYARAVIRAARPDEPAERLDRLVELRIARQARLSGGETLIGCFVLDEAVLRRTVGGREVMRRQLEHLIELAERPNVTMQVLPFDKGAHASLDGSFVTLRFPDTSIDADVVYVEGPAGNVYLEAVESVRDATARFDRLRVLAPDEAESRRFIARVLKEM